MVLDIICLRSILNELSGVKSYNGTPLPRSPPGPRIDVSVLPEETGAAPWKKEIVIYRFGDGTRSSSLSVETGGEIRELFVCFATVKRLFGSYGSCVAPHIVHLFR